MNAVLSALLNAIGQLGDRVVVMLLMKTGLLTLVAFALVGVGVYFGLTAGFAWFGMEDTGLAGAAAAVVIAALAFWFLFRVVAVAVIQFFADEIVIAVEEKHYPEAAQCARKLPFHRDLAISLRGVGRTLMFNALALPVALILLFTAIGPAVVFLLVNAVLLGREMTDMAWFRHCETQVEANPVPAFQRFLLGGAIAMIMLVPIVNFLAPILGAAAGTHLTHRAMGSAKEDL